MQGDHTNNQPLISIITPCLNAVEFIEQTIQSVLSQTYRNLEYIIIDGASTDGTVDIIRRYQDHLAYWHSKPDQCIAHAFNLGLSQARGEWILFLNADDYLFGQGVVDFMVPHLLEHQDADVVFGRVALVPRWDLTTGLSPELHGGLWNWQRFRFICTIPHQAAFTNRKYFDRVGFFDEKFFIASDYEHYLRAGPHLSARFVPHTVSVMRDGGLSLANIVPSLKWWRMAQIANKSASPVVIWGNYLARCFWCTVKEQFSGKERLRAGISSYT